MSFFLINLILATSDWSRIWLKGSWGWDLFKYVLSFFNLSSKLPTVLHNTAADHVNICRTARTRTICIAVTTRQTTTPLRTSNLMLTASRYLSWNKIALCNKRTFQWVIKFRIKLSLKQAIIYQTPNIPRRWVQRSPHAGRPRGNCHNLTFHLTWRSIFKQPDFYFYFFIFDLTACFKILITT